MSIYVTEKNPEYDFKLECSLLENHHDEEFGNLPYYGLKLEKYVDSVICESVQVNDISSDKEQVLRLKEIILKNMVTPVAFYDVVNDWLNQKYSF